MRYFTGRVIAFPSWPETMPGVGHEGVGFRIAVPKPCPRSFVGCPIALLGKG